MIVLKYLKILFAQIAVALKRLSSSVRSFVALLFVLLIGAGVIATQFGERLEDVQIVLFPFFCLLLVALPLQFQYRLPISLMVFSLALWAGSTFHLRILLPRALNDVDAFVVSRLVADDNSVFVRQFIKRYEIIANTYGLPPARLVAKHFDSQKTARAWFVENSTNQLFLVRGVNTWLEIVFNPAMYWSSESKQISSRESDSQNEKLRQKIKPIEFRVPWVPQALLLATIPESIGTPAQPREFVLHALGWLSQSLCLRESNQSRSESLSVEAAKRDALAQLSLDASAGLSNGVAAIGQYLQALSILDEYRKQGYLGRERIDEAILLLRNAAGFVRMETDPELFSMVFNNAGVAAMAVAETPHELYKARFWIRVAHDTAAFGEEVSIGAQIAMHNLMILDEAEAVSPIDLDPYSKSK